MLLPLIKWICIHFCVGAMIRWDLKHKENIFLGLLIPMGMVIAAGSCMTLTADSVAEAVVMQMLAMCWEVFEYRTYLKGQTQIERFSNDGRRLSRMASQGGRRLSKMASSKVAPGGTSGGNPTIDVTSSSGSVGVPSSTAGSVADSAATIPSIISSTDSMFTFGNMTASSSSTASSVVPVSGGWVGGPVVHQRSHGKFEVHQHPDRTFALTNLAISFGPMEGAASAITAALFLLVPLNPLEVSVEKKPVGLSLALWAVTFLFEVVLPEGVLAYMSQLASRGNKRIGNVVTALKTSFGRGNKLVVGFITLACATIMHKTMLARLCPVPNEATGVGLAAFSSCCAEYSVPCDPVPSGVAG